MNKFTRNLAITAVALLISSRAALATDIESSAIRTQLKHYEAALNASDTAAIMRLYADDAVFMPQHSAPEIGRDAVKAAYDHVFQLIKLDIRFEIDEVRQLSPAWAYARTRSIGTQKRLAGNGQPEAEGNQEIFLLHKEADGRWRFARYIFSTTNPPANR